MKKRMCEHMSCCDFRGWKPKSCKVYRFKCPTNTNDNCEIIKPKATPKGEMVTVTGAIKLSPYGHPLGVGFVPCKGWTPCQITFRRTKK